MLNPETAKPPSVAAAHGFTKLVFEWPEPEFTIGDVVQTNDTAELWNASYDAIADTLYVVFGESRVARHGAKRCLEVVARYDDDGEFIGITVVGVKVLFEDIAAALAAADAVRRGQTDAQS